jgi:hypothetical protein
MRTLMFSRCKAKRAVVTSRMGRSLNGRATGFYPERWGFESLASHRTVTGS